MDEQRTRRRVLQAAGLTAIGGTAGCLRFTSGSATESGGSTADGGGDGSDAGGATADSPFPESSCLDAMAEESLPVPTFGFEFAGGPESEIGAEGTTTSGDVTVSDGIMTFGEDGGEARVKNAPELDDLTVSLFAKPAVEASDQWNVMLWYSPVDEYWSGWGVEHGKGSVDFWVQGSEDESTQVLTKSASGLPVGEWTHVVGVKRGTDLTLYLDGEQAATAAFERGSISYGGSDRVDLVLGRHAGDGVGDRYYRGGLDSVAIWDTALAAGEVEDLLSVGQSCR